MMRRFGKSISSFGKGLLAIGSRMSARFVGFRGVRCWAKLRLEQ